MKIYKLWEFHIPNEIFDFLNKQSAEGINVKITNDYVVLSSADKKELSLNKSSYKAMFQIDSIRYSSALKDAGDYKITYFEQLGGDTSYVLHKGHFDKDAIIGALFGLKISDSDNNEIKFNFRYSGDTATFDFTSPVSDIIQLNSDGSVSIGGKNSTDQLNYTNSTLSVSVNSNNKNAFSISSSIPESVDLLNADISNYYIEYNPENKTLTKKTLEIDGSIIGDYGDVLNVFKDTNIAANMFTLYFTDTKEYIPRDTYAIVDYSNNNIISTQFSRITSVLITIEDNVPMHNYGFFKTSDRIFPSYAYVGSSFAYIKYSKAKASNNPCVLSDDNSLELALELYVRKNKGITIKKNNTVKTELLESDADFGNKFLNALKKGFGVFHDSLFNMKRYSDDGTHIKVQYNYQSSNNYYEVDIYDENTRYKIVETQKVGGDTQQHTVYYRLYKKNPTLELSNTKAVINMLKKVQIDFVSDIEGAMNYVSSVKIEPMSVIERSNTIIVNPNNFSVNFAGGNQSIDLFGMTFLTIDDKQVGYNILYQNTSDTIYVYDTSSKKNMDINDFIKLFNQSCDNYKMESSCSYAVLEYKALDNKKMSVQFPVSTLFLVELVNGPKGIYYRIYYKNANDIGHVEALSHQLKDF